MWKNDVFNTVAPDISFQNSFIFSWQKHNLDTKCKLQRYTAASPLSHSFHFSSFFSCEILEFTISKARVRVVMLIFPETLIRFDFSPM